MNIAMTFPDTVDEFMEQYKITDTECVYSNGIEYVPIFRMEQWFKHLEEKPKTNADRNNVGILIKGMEMPKSCMNCMFCGFAGANCELDTCLITGNAQKHIPYSKMSDCPLVEVVNDMKILASVEVQPVKYGKWIYDGEDYYCSACNAYYCGSGSDIWSGNLKFCPYCGARMDGET